MKIIYGDSADKISAVDFAKLKALDTYDSGDDTYAVDATHDGVLDSDHGELGASITRELLAILAGKPPLNTTTPNGKTYGDGIVDIPGGEFEMGSIDGALDERKSKVKCDTLKFANAMILLGHESSIQKHVLDGTTVRVTMTGFKLSKSEVTVGQYKAYLAAIGDPQYSKLPNFLENKEGDNFPVVGLTYEQMMDFCKYYGGTLPTAAQIEYASKGPSHTDVYGTPFYKAAIRRNGFKGTAEVCGTNDERANGWGVCDLAGNVEEATLDQYDLCFYSYMTTKDPSNPLTDPTSQRSETRGGSWRSDHDGDSRSTTRGDTRPNLPLYTIGFRCAWTLAPSSP